MISKIVYLFGAGATHAELSQIFKEKEASPGFLEKNGLLIKNVSKRVTKQASSQPYLKNLDLFFPKNGSSNIELLISLIEDNANQNHKNLKVAANLKKLVKADIKRVLSYDKKQKFYLHKALLELDRENEENEEILGYITLNYDSVLDDAYCEIKKTKYPNYYIPPFDEDIKNKPPLLKLHGSFEWKTKNNNDIVKIQSILPLGINKNYLQIPYNFIWGGAHEILRKCDVLRVIGCSLSQNDFQLIDLLFKAHSIRKEPFEIHIIDFDENGDLIKKNYDFFKKIKNFSEIFGTKGNNSNVSQEYNESFQKWLIFKAHKLDDIKIKNTNYLKKLIS